MKMTADQIASVCGGRILAGDGANAVSRIVLDSREDTSISTYRQPASAIL